jgi:type II secretory pathway pseudopilin PulG
MTEAGARAAPVTEHIPKRVDVRKWLCVTMLQSEGNPCSHRRAAFSISELVVSIGVLVLLFALAGQVFNLTIQSTGQATALTEVSQLIRAFENTVREDLKHVEPGRSMIVIQSNPVNAFWSQSHRDAARGEQGGSADPSRPYSFLADPAREDKRGGLTKPRADLLMVFSAREARSFAHRSSFSVPITSSVQQVVYGHAAMGEYVRAGGTTYRFEPGPAAFPEDVTTKYPSTTIVSQVPASDWHLARRSVVLLPTGDPTTSLSLDDPMVVRCETDIVEGFNYERQVLRPDIVLFNWSGGNAWPGMDKWHLPAIFAKQPGGTLQRAIPFARSALDPTPPADLRDLNSNPMLPLGQYFLPNCASFKVEWALDPRSELVAGRLDGVREPIWFDQGRYDPANAKTENPAGELIALADRAGAGTPLNDALYDLLDNVSVHPDNMNAYSLADRIHGTKVQGERGVSANGWETLSSDGRPNLIVFGASRLDVTTGELVEEDLFPAALKITIDLYDREGRFDRPTRHVIVVPVGG